MIGACEQLQAIIAAWRTGQELTNRVNQLGDVRQCIASELQRSATAGDWQSFNRYVLAALAQPDPSMTAVLCGVLDRWKEIATAASGSRILLPHREDMADLLGDIRDPEAIPCLERSIGADIGLDDNRQFSRKCIWALSLIGTAEAHEAIRRAAKHDDPVIREYAMEELLLA